MNEKVLMVMKSVWGQNSARVFSAPARINIIGEHVDYLGGLVLPAAIQYQTVIAIAPNQTNKYRLHSVLFSESLEIEKIEYLSQSKWANYILGVIDELQKSGLTIPGFDLVIDGNIPHGAGLSSSASLEVVLGYALSSLFHLKLSRENIAILGQKAENHFVGTKCGIMDQFIISVGRSGYCVLLNTETLSYEYKEIHLGNCQFYLINSHVKHSLDTSEYNVRRKECEMALQKIQIVLPDIKNLYSLPEDFTPEKAGLDPVEWKRVKHVIGEKKRTSEILHFFEAGQPENAGKILFEAHHSLSKNFEVSCPETDFLVELLQKENVLGARMIGGGFGGCILVLDQKGRFERVSENVKKLYKERFHIDCEFYQFTISDGVKEL